jgi:epoxyqueuosine reductase
MKDWIFGCDICQDVCPWNRFSTPHAEPLFSSVNRWLNYSKNDWKDLTDELFTNLFKNSAIKRTKKDGLMRNINFIHTKS